MLRANISRFRLSMIFILLGGLLTIAAIIVRTNSSDSILIKGREISRARVQISRVMRMKGPAAAYVYTKTLFPGDVSFISQHLLMHVFAELAYARYGADGMIYCDDDFAYGCYHGFMAQSIVHEGLNIAENLFAACMSISNATACQHGIGHGIMQHLGNRRLKDALDVCVQIGAPISAAGCFGGAYMEYHFPALTTGGIQSALPFDHRDPYDVCPELPAQYQPSCYFRLVEWWEQISGRNYDMMGDLCVNIDGEHMREQCFVAIGTTSASTSGRNLEVVIRACDRATRAPKSKKYHEACVRGLEIQR